MVRRTSHAVLALALVSPHFATAQDDRPTRQPAGGAAPMAAFGRLTGGEWRVTAASGQSMYHAWHWGPGGHSVRRMTDGKGANGDPWREVQVYYWHPTRKEVRVLGLSPVWGGVSEGSVRFGKDAADGTFDLYQTGGRRRMGLRWAFGAPDKYRDTLLEADGRGVLTTLVEFDHVRSQPPAIPRPFAVEGARLSDRLKAFAPLLGQTWESAGEGGLGTRTTFTWVPLADAIYVRVTGKSDEHVLDGYVYHHTGAKQLRLLALAKGGGVYEGDVTPLGDGLEFDLRGHEGDRTSRQAVRVDFEPGGAVRQRAWSAEGAGRRQVLDARHTRVESGRPR